MESGEGNAKRGCGRWMEECGRGAAVEQLTARGMVSIPAMGGNSTQQRHTEFTTHINPRNGGAIAVEVLNIYRLSVSIPAMGGNRTFDGASLEYADINPRDGGQ